MSFSICYLILINKKIKHTYNTPIRFGSFRMTFKLSKDSLLSSIFLLKKEQNCILDNNQDIKRVVIGSLPLLYGRFHSAWWIPTHQILPAKFKTVSFGRWPKQRNFHRLQILQKKKTKTDKHRIWRWKRALAPFWKFNCHFYSLIIFQTFSRYPLSGIKLTLELSFYRSMDFVLPVSVQWLERQNKR